MNRLIFFLLLAVFCGELTFAEEDSKKFKKLPTEAWSKVIPADKSLSPEWEKSLFERGSPRSYTGDALMHIGMPVGGITTGALVYLGGDG